MCHNMAKEFIKADLTYNFGSPWNTSQNKICIGIQMNNTVYPSKEKNCQYSSEKKPPLQNIVPHQMFITWNFIANFYLNIV